MTTTTTTASTSAADYPPALAALLEAMPLAPLGPGQPLTAYQAQLQALTDEAITPSNRPANRPAAALCRAGLWLAYHFLDQAHRISQDDPTPEGSYWHALMHRREPDAWNSKYWFRRVGDHPVIAQLRQQAANTLGYPYTTPFDFVDFCERVRGQGSADEQLAREVQRLEWRLLFDHCYCLARSGG
jgi:hypothetical protein